MFFCKDERTDKRTLLQKGEKKKVKRIKCARLRIRTPGNRDRLLRRVMLATPTPTEEEEEVLEEENKK